MHVNVMSRLSTKDPLTAIHIGGLVMRYIKHQPGGLHYGTLCEWGPRENLLQRRTQQTLEVFTDISYATGGKGRSVQGLVAYYGGSPVAWSSSRQAFATLSTTESELVSMCEALVLGNSVGSLVAEVQQHPVEELTRVMYADNLGAISLAKGGAAASWRTRHLRIRSHALRDAVTSGGWILLHLRGDELVADGLTKALVGQSQEKFITDLCMRIASGVEEQVEQDEKERTKLATAGAALIAGGAQCQGEAGDALTLAGATVLCVAAARERKPESNVPQMRVMMNRRDGAGGGRDERYHERSRSRDDGDPPVPDVTPTPTDVASETGPGVAVGNGDGGEHLPEAAASSSSGIGAAARTIRNQQTADLANAIPEEDQPENLVHTPPAEVMSQARLRRERDAARSARAIAMVNRASRDEPGGEEEVRQMATRDYENLSARWRELDNALNRRNRNPTMENRNPNEEDENISITEVLRREDEIEAAEASRREEEIEARIAREASERPGMRSQLIVQENMRVVQDALRRIGIAPRGPESPPTSEEEGREPGQPSRSGSGRMPNVDIFQHPEATRDEERNSMDTDPDHDGPAPEEAEEEVDEEAREAASQANIQAIIQEEFADLEENLNLMVGAGTITQDQAIRLARTVMEVSAGTRVTGVVLEETDLEETEGIARMDVVVRGPAQLGGPAVYHVTGVARRDVSRILHGNEESRRVRNEEPREEDHRDEVEREEGAQEEDLWEEQTDESAEEKARREAHNQEVYARRACLNYAEYQMFQRRARTCRRRYSDYMEKIGIQITPENFSNNELIKFQEGEEEEFVEVEVDEESQISWDPEGDTKDEKKPSEPSRPPRRVPREPPFPPPGFSTSVREVRRDVRSRSREAAEIVQRWQEESRGMAWEDVPPWRRTLILRGKGQGFGKAKGAGKRRRKGGKGRDDPIHEPKDPRGPPGGGKGPDGGAGGSGAMREEARGLIAVRMLQVPQMPLGAIQAMRAGRDRRQNQAHLVRTRWTEARIDELMDHREDTAYGDYWEYFGHRGLLRRHHSLERQELFGHAAEDEQAWREAPITRDALATRRRTTIIKLDQTGMVYHIHDSWVFREEEDQRRPEICDVPWIGFTDFGVPGLEPLGFLPPYDPDSALSEPGSEEDWDNLSARTVESSTASPGSGEMDPPREIEDESDRRTWLTCGSTFVPWCGGEDLEESEEEGPPRDGRPGSSMDARSIPRLRMLKKITKPEEDDEEDRWTVVTEKKGEDVKSGGGYKDPGVETVTSSVSKTVEVGDKKVSMACTMKVTVEKKDTKSGNETEDAEEKDPEGTDPTTSKILTVEGVDSSYVVESVQAVEKEKDVGKDEASGSGDLIRNPWNAFQHANKGKKWSMDRMREEYRKSKEATKEHVKREALRSSGEEKRL